MIFGFHYIWLLFKHKKMTLRQKQSVFLHNIAKLILFAFENGYELTGGELHRTTDQQLLYFEGYELLKTGSNLHLKRVTPKSKTMNSDHLIRMAIDLNVFINNEYRTDKEAFEKLHKYWKSLHSKNYSGYQWGWDFNHFGMKI